MHKKAKLENSSISRHKFIHWTIWVEAKITIKINWVRQFFYKNFYPKRRPRELNALLQSHIYGKSLGIMFNAFCYFHVTFLLLCCRTAFTPVALVIWFSYTCFLKQCYLRSVIVSNYFFIAYLCIFFIQNKVTWNHLPRTKDGAIICVVAGQRPENKQRYFKTRVKNKIKVSLGTLLKFVILLDGHQTRWLQKTFLSGSWQRLTMKTQLKPVRNYYAEKWDCNIKPNKYFEALEQEFLALKWIFLSFS